MRIIVFILLFISLKGSAQLDYFSFALYNGVGYGSTTTSSQTISQKKFINLDSTTITTADGGGGVGLFLNGVNNVIIEDCFFSTTFGSGLVLKNCDNITIRRNVFAKNNRAIYAVNCGANILIEDNDFLNTEGHDQYNTNTSNVEYHRGQIIQMNTANGAGIIIRGNVSEQFFGRCYNQDLVNLYACVGTSGSPLTVFNNKFRGGSPSGSGGGIIAGDGDGEWILIDSNYVSDPGQYGISCAGGQDITFVDNKVYGAAFDWTNIGYAVADWDAVPNCSDITMGSSNKSNYKNAAGTNNAYFTNGDCGTVVGGGAVHDGTVTALTGTLRRYLTENQEWIVRADTTFQSFLVRKGLDIASTGHGGPPEPIDLTIPNANAGSNQSISISTATLSGSATPSTPSVGGGTNTIIGYHWVQVSGPNTATMSASTSATNNLSAMITGTYEFRLEVQQNNDQFDYDTYHADWVQVTVNTASDPPYPPGVKIPIKL